MYSSGALTTRECYGRLHARHEVLPLGCRIVCATALATPLTTTSTAATSEAPEELTRIVALLLVRCGRLE